MRGKCKKNSAKKDNKRDINFDIGIVQYSTGIYDVTAVTSLSLSHLVKEQQL